MDSAGITYYISGGPNEKQCYDNHLLFHSNDFMTSEISGSLLGPSFRNHLIGPGHSDEGRGFICIFNPCRSALPVSTAAAFRDTGFALCDAQLQFAVQVDFTTLPGELEHVEREGVGRSHPVSVYVHGLVSRVFASLSDELVSGHTIRG